MPGPGPYRERLKDFTEVVQEETRKALLVQNEGEDPRHEAVVALANEIMRKIAKAALRRVSK